MGFGCSSFFVTGPNMISSNFSHNVFICVKLRKLFIKLTKYNFIQLLTQICPICYMFICIKLRKLFIKLTKLWSLLILNGSIYRYKYIYIYMSITKILICTLKSRVLIYVIIVTIHVVMMTIYVTDYVN